MKSKARLVEPEAEDRKVSPVRGSATSAPRTRATHKTAAAGTSSSAAKRNGGAGSQGVSPGPSSRGSPAAQSRTTTAPGPGRTPQTKRREFSISHGDKSSPGGSPRSRPEPVKSANAAAVSRKPASSAHQRANRSEDNNPTETCRKSSNSSQDSGIGRDLRTVTATAGRQDRNRQNRTGRAHPPIIRTTSPESVEVEVSHRKKFEELCDVKNVEQGMVKVPGELLDDLIHKGRIENYYDVDDVPVASGLFATVRKCTHKETGVEYAAKFSSRVRCGVDCTAEVLHEIALLSICAESSKIVHLKDVFQNKHEIVLVLEYAPGGDFQSVLDDDMVPFEQDVEGFIVQLLEALSYIHQRKIAHLDIKPQNIVLMSEFPNCEIKLCDLEVSRVIQDTEHIREIIGTPDYVAPEILGMEPITLSADIWSLGVLAYVLLTGFSPFGGDSDQETLRNITTAPLDFPAELFEGVSDQAKDFIRQCLHRNPKKRPTVDDCLQHPWISQNAEPPSPSPLMLKIPAPDHFSSEAPASGSRRSCQTCRDKITERKRYLSKSREAIFEKVANSNLKKSLSKSRERLCDMRLTLSKSRDYLNESKQVASRSQDKFYGFKSLSKSQEVLSQALGGSMKRMVNGAVSDISPAHLPINPRVYLDTPDNCDFVILPGSTVLMSHNDLLNLAASTSADHLLQESGQSTPTRGGGANTPLLSLPDLSATASVVDAPPMTDHNSNSNPALLSSSKPSVEPLIEVAEEDDQTDNSTDGSGLRPVYRRERDTRSMESNASSDAGPVLRRRSEVGKPNATRSAKEEKNNLNYETKQSMSRSTSSDGIHKFNNAGNSATSSNNKNNNNKNTHSSSNNSKNNNNAMNNNNVRRMSRSETAEVAVQVNLSAADPAPSSVGPDVATAPAPVTASGESSGSQPTGLNMLEAGNARPRLGGGAGGLTEARLRRGRSSDNLGGGGDQTKRYSWREELERFRNTKKPLGVSDLISTFTSKQGTPRKVSANDPSFYDLDSINNKRRGSLQINLNQTELAKLTERAAEAEKARLGAKLQRRKSTSSILPVRSSELKMPGIQEDVGTANKIKTFQQTTQLEKQDKQKETSGEKEEEVKSSEPSKKGESQLPGVRSEEGNVQGVEGKKIETSPEMEVDCQNNNENAPDLPQQSTATHPRTERKNPEPNNGENTSLSTAYLEKVNDRKKTWDYFEINHPKAISDKKLEQLKAKYARRKTETSLQTAAAELADCKSASREAGQEDKTVATPPPPQPSRTLSMPAIKGLNDLKRKTLDLAWDPLTGESVGLETESLDSGKGGEMTREPSVSSTEDAVATRKVWSEQISATDKAEEADQRTSFVRRLSQAEEIIPREKVLQCFIDPFTGEFLTSHVPRESQEVGQQGHRNNNVKNLRVDVHQGDEGVGSLPDTPTDLGKIASHPTALSPLRRPVDDTDEVVVGLRTCSPANDSCDSASDRLSAFSSEETVMSSPESRLDTTEANARRRQAMREPVDSISEKQRSNIGGRERAKANKVCTGSFSRGFQRFRSESPVTRVASTRPDAFSPITTKAPPPPVISGSNLAEGKSRPTTEPTSTTTVVPSATTVSSLAASCAAVMAPAVTAATTTSSEALGKEPSN